MFCLSSVKSILCSLYLAHSCLITVVSYLGACVSFNKHAVFYKAEEI